MIIKYLQKFSGTYEIILSKSGKSAALDREKKLQNMPSPQNTTNYQLQIFDANNSQFKNVKKVLDALDVNTLTPIEALIKLSEIKKLCEK